MKYYGYFLFYKVIAKYYQSKAHEHYRPVADNEPSHFLVCFVFVIFFLVHCDLRP